MGYYSRPAYRPGQTAPYQISRSKIDLFMQCPRCFWLDARLRIKRPSSPPFRINSAIDELLKKEFDVHRLAQTKHPLSEAFGLDLVPFRHEKMDEWRDALKRGISYLHQETNLKISGGVDDVWVDKKSGEIVIVDYKATSKNGEVNLDADWQIGYKRQIEIYQWLFRQNGFNVNDTGYFVYTNARLDADGFHDKLEFKTKIIPYKGDDSWVEPAILELKKCLDSDTLPPVGKQVMDPSKPCEFCSYARQWTKEQLDFQKAKKIKTAKELPTKN